MILSFHPCIEADRNIICAGRDPDTQELAAIRAAAAVILPQGCSRLLYEMARENCRHVFPNYDQRFSHPGKIGQIELFRKNAAPHPETVAFQVAGDVPVRGGKALPDCRFVFPFVFKFSWGGEGESVFLVRSESDFENLLQQAAQYEHGGMKGFLIQEYIPNGGKTLRVVVVGRTIAAYWRIQDGRNRFYANLSKGARIDAVSEPQRRMAAIETVREFCGRTGVNLAGFDLIFSTEPEKHGRQPRFLEINYFFGRKGLGGSPEFYRLLQAEAEKWLAGLGLSLPKIPIEKGR